MNIKYFIEKVDKYIMLPDETHVNIAKSTYDMTLKDK
jgi:hypothetical protein